MSAGKSAEENHLVLQVMQSYIIGTKYVNIKNA